MIKMVRCIKSVYSHIEKNKIYLVKPYYNPDIDLNSQFYTVINFYDKKNGFEKTAFETLLVNKPILELLNYD